MSTPDSVSSISSAKYAFRHTTTQKKSKITYSDGKTYRKILPLTDSASINREEGHNCNELNLQLTALKVCARFVFSMQRFIIAHGWGCETIRGKTLYNGSQSHCKGSCEAAHAALSPSLYDDMMSLIFKKVQEEGYENLSPTKKGYFSQRFVLTEEDEQKLSDKKTGFDHFLSIVSRLLPEEWKRSFSGEERNATFDNPKAANRVDWYLEKSLRPEEDALAKECKEQQKSPKEAIEALYSKYKECLQNLSTNLKKGQEHLTNLEKVWNQLIESQKVVDEQKDPSKLNESFTKHLTNVKSYLEAYGLYFTKLSGVPELKTLKSYLECHQSPYVLRTLSKKDPSNALQFFQDNKIHLKIPEDKETLFKEGLTEIEKRQTEVQEQLKIVSNPFDEINSMLKMYFGVKDSTGVLKTPTKDQAAEQLNKKLKQLTPSRSDLHLSKTYKATAHVLFSGSKRTADGAIKNNTDVAKIDLKGDLNPDEKTE